MISCPTIRLTHYHHGPCDVRMELDGNFRRRWVDVDSGKKYGDWEWKESPGQIEAKLADAHDPIDVGPEESFVSAFMRLGRP